MTMGNELTVRQSESVGIFTPPDIVLANAMTAAKALMSVVSLKKKPVIMNGEQYLEYEDWQTAGQFYGYTVRTGEAEPVEVDGVKGAKAHADLINLHTGQVLGGAEAYCMRDEEKWNTRPKYEWQGEGTDRKKVKVGDEVVPWFQLASMAQTRAGAKAFRNRLAWVVVLAGYRPTPAEEIADMVTEHEATAGHFCKVHNTPFFMRGKMKSFAHPIGDTGEWCYEHSKAVPAKPPAPAKSSADELFGEPPQAEHTKAAIVPRPAATNPPAGPKDTSQGEQTAQAATATNEEVGVAQHPQNDNAAGTYVPPEIVRGEHAEVTRVDLGIDMDWLRESLNKLSWTTVSKWLKDKYSNATGTRVSEIIRSLNTLQRQEFVKEVEDRLKLI